ncbi:hypothetical protein FDA94_05960 [Herbidospora galbida]|uniref:Uncharacterized protein n=1 Tax=Herbidospora galbida TaxID=2575442 RepID=A0A4U3MLV2_9ACTN|nr:hypothetical protein [Herbidospora galbida]TKK90535.1 hypothetical protein FDA94_05960 [Herbidospora galbida]
MRSNLTIYLILGLVVAAGVISLGTLTSQTMTSFGVGSGVVTSMSALISSLAAGISAIAAWRTSVRPAAEDDEAVVRLLDIAERADGEIRKLALAELNRTIPPLLRKRLAGRDRAPVVAMLDTLLTQEDVPRLRLFLAVYGIA